MTAAGQAALALDAARVSEWLAGAAGCVPPLRFTAIGNGFSNLTYRVDDARGGAWVLRRPPRGPLLASAHDMAREHGILDRLAAAGAPVPAPVALCTDLAVTGCVFFVMELVAGTVLDTRAAAARLGEAERRRSALSLMTTLADLHALDVDAIGLGDLARRDAYAERQLRRWSRQWEGSRTEDDPRIDAVARRLAAIVPPQDEVAVVHGDYRLDNVVVDAAGTVRAVLDWELCTLGDPLADLGLLLAYTPSSEAEATPVEDGVFLLPGFPAREELAAAYAAASGRSLDALPFWIALGYWKIAIILQGVRRRRLDGAGGGAAELEPVIASFIARAVEAVP